MEDPSLRVDIDKESGQTILRGIGELHLEIVCDKIRRQFNLGVTTGRAYVNYRESVNPDNGIINKNHTYDRTFNFKRMYASIDFEVTPVGGSQEPTYIISEDVKKSMSNDEYASMIEGLIGSFSRGPQGFPVVGMHIVVVGILKDQDTTPGSIRACISLFMDTLLKSDSKIILEPYMALEVEAPSVSLGDVLSDITVKRRGQIREIINRDGSNISTILADAPLATMLGYATVIRSTTQGEGSFSMEYLSHLPVEQDIVNTFLNS
mmetsp:Transcript_1426/g.1563  ORF Transcript_1426/g.1563 Transcript_1426/m.1563 type:complete len:264 (-) Transcript_1426:29-820(-)